MKQKFMLLMDVASSLIKAGDREASKEVLNSAHKVSLNFKEANDEWVAQLKLAQCYVAADDDEMARRLFNESLKIARASSRQLREKTEKQRAQFKGKGRNPYILQQKISVAGLSAPTVSPTEGWVALVYIRLGYIDQAIKLAKELGPLERAIVLAQLDSALIKEGDAKKAARIYSQGEALVERELNSIIKDMGSYEMEARQKDQSVIYLAGISWAIGYPAPALQLVKHIKNVETKKKFLIQLFEGLVLGQYVDLTAKLFPADFPNFSGQRYRYTQQTWQREAEGGLLRDFYAYDEPKNQHSFESNDSFVNFLSKPFTPREKKIASRLLDAFNATN
jgi:tetratricopeptide (TPR) repeat protein